MFAFCGILPWLYFQETVLRSCNAVVEQSNLIKKTLFPSEILPITVALANLVTHLVGFGVLLAVLMAMNLAGWAVLVIPLYLILLVVLAVGLGWLVASLQVFLRDTSQVLSVIMVFLVLVYAGLLPGAGRSAALQVLDPIEPADSRGSWLQNRPAREPSPRAQSLGLLALFAITAFLSGGLVFRNTKREFVDVL